jgi:hypothetical protein
MAAEFWTALYLPSHGLVSQSASVTCYTFMLHVNIVFMVFCVVLYDYVFTKQIVGIQHLYTNGRIKTWKVNAADARFYTSRQESWCIKYSVASP